MWPPTPRVIEAQINEAVGVGADVGGHAAGARHVRLHVRRRRRTRLRRSRLQTPRSPKWSAAAGDSIVIGGFCELGDDARLYNSAVMVDTDGVIATYRKTHLWDREKLIFTPGAELPRVRPDEARCDRGDGLL